MLEKDPGAYSEETNKGRKEKLSREGDEIKFVDLRFDRRYVAWFWVGGTTPHSLKFLEIGVEKGRS